MWVSVAYGEGFKAEGGILFRLGVHFHVVFGWAGGGRGGGVGIWGSLHYGYVRLWETILVSLEAAVFAEVHTDQNGCRNT